MARTTKPAEILEAVRQRLIDDEVFGAVNCLIAQPEQNWQTPPGQTWATIWIEGGTFDPEAIDGKVPLIKSAISITLHSQILADQVGEDRRAATDGERGLLPLADSVFQSLWLHDLADVDGVALLAEPIRPMGLSRPDRVPEVPATIVWTWEVVFEWTVDA